MSAPVMTKARRAELVEQAEQHIRSQGYTQGWKDLYPIAEPFIAKNYNRAIPDAVTFLIDQKQITEEQRGAAEKAFREIRRKIEQ